MDVQTESADPLPGEPQSSGKIRKGFKLFGKRKPGNIFAIRNKGDGNSKSPVNKSKSMDGLSESGEPDLVQEPDRDRGQEASQGERREEEALGGDGIQALARSRNSISSTSSARSLKFLSLLRGGRRGTGDRRVHTVSQPVGRQRRGLKGLFGTVRLRSKDKEDAPPSPLLKSSRANSVEIIKEDLTLTPKVPPRSLDSPETDPADPVKSLSSQDSTPTTPTESVDSRVTADDVSRSDEHVPPLPTSQPPLEPGDNSLSTLLADISSLLTFESISGGGDVIANVEAEWGKANASSKPTSPLYKPSTPSPLTSAPASNDTGAKAPPVFPGKTSAPPAQTTSSAAAEASPLATSSDAPSSGFAATLSSSTSTIRSSPTLAARKPSWAREPTESVPFTRSSPSPTGSRFSASTAAPPTTSAAPFSCPSVRPAVTFTVSMLPSETPRSPKLVPLVAKPGQVTTAPPEYPPVTHSPPPPVAFTEPQSVKRGSVSNPQLQPSTLSSRSAGGESTASVCSISSSYFEPLISKIATLYPSPATDSVSVSKPSLISDESDSNQTPTSLANVPQVCPSPVLTSKLKTEPSPPPVSAPPSPTLSDIPALTIESMQLFVDEDELIPAAMVPAPPVLETPTPSATENQTSQSESTLGPAQTEDLADLADKDPPTPTQPSDFKDPLALTQPSNSKDASAPTQLSDSKDPPAPTHLSDFKGSFSPTQPSDSKDPPSPTQPSDSKEPPALIEKVQSKFSFAVDLVAPDDLPSLKTDENILGSLSNVSPASDSESAVTLSPSPVPVLSPISALSSLSWPSEVPSKIRGSAEILEQVGSVTCKEPQRAQTVPSKKAEQHKEALISPQVLSKEGKTQLPRPSGLSKIPVVGGGRAGKLPVRESQHVNSEAVREPPTPETEKERPHFNSHDSGKDKSFDAGAAALTSKRTQEKSQQLPQPKVLTSSPRDSKIPMKHSPQPHTATQIPAARDTPRTKIPVSRVPVRRVVTKPAVTYGSSQNRK